MNNSHTRSTGSDWNNSLKKVHQMLGELLENNKEMKVISTNLGAGFVSKPIRKDKLTVSDIANFAKLRETHLSELK